MFESNDGYDMHGSPPYVRSRMVRTQVVAGLPAFLLLAMAFLYPGPELIIAVSTLSGSFAVGLSLGFVSARSISSKADSTGVYRRRMPSAAVMIGVCATLVVLFLGLAFGLLFALHSSSIQLDGVLWIVVLLAWGMAAGAPVGTLLFERRTRSRLWILWIPSQWWPEWIEYRFEYNPSRWDTRESAA
jgi:hypothetical protein